MSDDINAMLYIYIIKRKYAHNCYILISWWRHHHHGDICGVTGPLCWEFTGNFTGHRWIPRTKASYAELWCILDICAWINGWVNNREAGDLRHHRDHYDVIVMSFCIKHMILHTRAPNGWINNREAGDLRHHRDHYDVIVMSFCIEHMILHTRVSMDDDTIWDRWRIYALVNWNIFDPDKAFDTKQLHKQQN